MSKFSVKPGALRTYADTLSGAATNGGLNIAHIYYSKPTPYVDKYVTIDQSSGASDLFRYILSSNTTLVTNLEATYGSVAQELSMSGLALAGSAQVYEDNDAEVNAKMDQLWPGIGKPAALDPDVGGGQVSDPSTPLQAVPSDSVLVPDFVHWIMDYAGWLSIGNDILKIASLFGIDPAGWLAKAVEGDYSQVAQAGHAATALADFERNTATTIAAGLSTMTGQWTGHAADQATDYFHQFANAFDDHASQLDEVSNKYELLAQALYKFALWISGKLADVIDWLIKCAVRLAAAGCLAEVPGIDVIAGIIGAYTVWKTKEAVETFINICTNVTNYAEDVIALTVGIAGLCAPGTAKTDFPTAAYANGAQA